MNFSKLDGLVAWYPMTIGSGTTLKDYKGSNDGTISGAVWEKEKTGQYSLDFDGSNDYVAIGDTGEESVNSICFWINCIDATSENIIDLNGTATINTDASDDIEANNFVSPTIYIDGFEATRLINDTWHYVVINTDTGLDVSDFDIGRISANYFSGKIANVMIFNRALTANEIKALYKQTYIK